MVTIDSRVVWARRQVPDGTTYGGRYAEPRWHRVAKVDYQAIFTACNRVIVFPVDTTADNPNGEHACTRCAKPRWLPAPS